MQEKDYIQKIKKLESQLKELEAKADLFEQIINLLPLGIQLFDKEGLSYQINKKQGELLGLPNLKEGIGQFNVLTDPFALSTGAAKLYKKAYQGKKHQHTFEYNLGQKDNEWNTRQDSRIFNEEIIPIKDAQGAVQFVLAILEDITERQHAEKELIDSEKKHRELINNSPDIFYKFSNKKGALYCSARTIDILGYEPEEFQQNPLLWRNSIHPEDQRKVIEAASNCSNAKHFSLEYRIKNKNGKWVWLHDYFMNKTQIGDEIIIEGHAADITERKIAEHAILDNQILLKTVFNTLSVGMSITDEQGNLIDCNKESERILGISKEEHLARNHNSRKWTFIRPDHTPMPVEEFASVRALKENREIHNVEMGIVKADEVTWISVNASPINIEGYGVVITYIDHSERIKTQEERMVFNRNFEAFLQQTTDFVYFKDIDSRFLFCSQTLAKITGHKHWKEMIGKHDFEVFPPDTAKIYYEEELPVFKDGTPLLDKIDPYYDETGNKRFVLTNKWPLYDEDNKIVGIFGISRDITDRLAANQQVKESQEELRELYATKDKLFSIVAHDLRSPINALIGMNELVSEKIDLNDSFAAKRLLGMVHKTSQQALELLENLLQWSRLQTGNLKFNPTKFCFEDIVQKVATLLKPNCDKKNIIVATCIEPQLYLEADKLMIETILRNLISNAIKYSHHGGTIEVAAEKKAGQVLISVADQGIGIPTDKVGKLFDITENYTTLGTQQEKGTGLGLVLCKDFVECHNGKIWIESIESKETKVFFTIKNQGMSEKVDF